jgi:hypothetical protein
LNYSKNIDTTGVQDPKPMTALTEINDDLGALLEDHESIH